MKFKDFIELYDGWHNDIKVNDNNLHLVIEDKVYKVVENHPEFLEKEVVAFGIFDCLVVRLNM